MAEPRMNDEFYQKLRRRVEHQLAKAPRYATLSAVFFTLAAVLVGIVMLISPLDLFRGYLNYLPLFAYVGIMVWSGVLMVHAGSLFFQSGAWGRRRESLIQAEILEAMKSYDLDEDEWIDLHLALSKDAADRAQPFRRLMYHALMNGFGWIGGLGTLWSIWFFFGLPDVSYLFSFFVLLPFITVLTIFLLPLRVIFQKPDQNVEHLRAVYGGKPKRTQAEAEFDHSRLVQTGDDGELIFEDELEVDPDELENPTLARTKRKLI